MSQILTLNGNVVTNGNNILTAPESTSLEANKNVNLVGGTTIVEPSTGYDSMGQVTANVAELEVCPSTISTLVGTTWYLNETLTSFPWSVEEDWQKYAKIMIPLEVEELDFHLYEGNELVYEYSSGDPDEEGDIWIEAYTLVDSIPTASSDSVRTVTFTSGTVMTDTDFISWLKENARFVSPSSFTTSIDNIGTISVTTNQGGYINNGEGFAITQTIEAHNVPTHSGPTSSSGSVSISHTQAAGFTLGGTSSTSFTLTTKSAQTYTPTTTNQTIAAGRWLTGTQTIKGDANLVAGNIKKDVPIFGVTGTYEISFSTIRTGSGAPSSSLGVDGDIYIQTS